MDIFYFHWFSSFTLFFILFNYRGRRTVAAAFLVITGSILIIRTELYTGEITEYYFGVFLLMFGVWVNASFYYFYYKFIKPVFGLFPSFEKRKDDFGQIIIKILKKR